MAEKLNLISNLAASKGSGSTLKYPLDIFENATDYIKFSFYKYNPPFAAVAGAQQGAESANEAKNNSNVLQNYNQSNSNYEVYEGSKNIMLYMPEDIQTGYQTDWGGKGFSNIAAGMLRSGGAGLNLNGGSLIESIKQQIGTAATAGPTMAAEALAEAISGLGAGDVSGENVLQGVSGVILNPNTELMFGGFKLRSQSLNFKFVPRNKKEAIEVRNIIQQFKKVMLPTLGQSTGQALEFFKQPEDVPADGADSGGYQNSNANYIGVPGLCQMKFMRGTKLHPYLPQYKIAAITDLGVNYTPDGNYATYYSNDDDNGAPVAITMSITLQETKLVYSQDISMESGSSY